MRFTLALALIFLPGISQAASMSADDSRIFADLLVRSTTSKTADLERLSCTWNTLSPASICSYSAASGDHDSFAWHGNAVVKVLKNYVEPVQRRDGVWQLEISNLRCGESCSFDVR